MLDNAQEQLQRWKQKRKEREEREQQKRDRDQRHRLLGELREEMKKPARAPRQYQTFVPDTTEPERMDPREALAAALAAANVLDAGSGSAEPVSFEPEPVGMSWEMRLIDAELEAIDELDTGPPE
ncbi:MAG TPA: hypothetical protein VF420_13360 [Casimicrobiaceae bacterium]